jgi:hypothetical protein
VQPGEAAEFMAQLKELPTVMYQISQQAESYAGQLRILRREARDTLDLLDQVEARLHSSNLLADRLKALQGS